MIVQEILDECKPCPFCGKSKFDFTSRDNYYRLKGENGSACVAIRCLNCDLDLYDHSDNAKYETRIAKLVDKWNTRAYEKK